MSWFFLFGHRPVLLDMDVPDTIIAIPGQDQLIPLARDKEHKTVP